MGEERNEKAKLHCKSLTAIDLECSTKRGHELIEVEPSFEMPAGKGHQCEDLAMNARC